MAEASNYVAEWFGHVVWPPEAVDDSDTARSNQINEICPFLTSATNERQGCGKQKKTGFCTASSKSTGAREDWLACPYRVFDQHFALIREAVRRIYRIPEDPIDVFPITRASEPAIKQRIRDATEGRRVFLFSANKLGGEIDIPETDASPGSKVDVTICEAIGISDNKPNLGQTAIFEIQTADFHGSPLHAINAIRELRDSDPQGYHDVLKANGSIAGKKMEGPNKANIFKRTIYQIIVKIQMAKDPRCAGFCVVLPEPVWNSWASHLGQPELQRDENDPEVSRLKAPEVETAEGAEVVEPEPAWILVFRIDRDSTDSPRPLAIVHRIATDSRALAHYAFDEAPEQAIERGALDRYRDSFKQRLKTNW